MRRLLNYLALGAMAAALIPTGLMAGWVVVLLLDEHYTLKECRAAEEVQFEWFVYRCEHLWSTWNKTNQPGSFDAYWPDRLPIWAAQERCRDEVRTRVAKERCDEKFDPHAPRV